MKVSQLNSEVCKYHNSICVLSHTDLDGYGAQAVILNMLQDVLGVEGEIAYLNANYDNIIPDEVFEYEMIFITDLSVSNSKDVSRMMQLYERGKFIVWIDHHQSSLDIMEINPKLREIYGKVDTRGCGTLLAWILYQMMMVAKVTSPEDDFDIEEVIKEFSELDVSDILNPENEMFGVYPPYYRGFGFDHIPTAIRLIDDHDRHTLKYPASSKLNTAFGVYPPFTKNPTNHFFKDLLCWSDQVTTHQVMEYVDFGEDLIGWQKINQLQHLNSKGFIGYFNKEGASNIPVLCLNTSFWGSSTFEPLLRKCGPDEIGYNYACIYGYFNDRWIHTIYCADPQPSSDNPSEIKNAKDIAKKFGGGGHIGAAGFTLDHPVEFLRTEPLSKAAHIFLKNEISKQIGEVRTLMSADS